MKRIQIITCTVHRNLKRQKFEAWLIRPKTAKRPYRINGLEQVNLALAFAGLAGASNRKNVSNFHELNPAEKVDIHEEQVQDELPHPDDALETGVPHVQLQGIEVAISHKNERSRCGHLLG